MAVLNRLREIGAWLVGTPIDPYELEAIDAARPAQLNALTGGIWAPTAVISVQGAGLTCPQIAGNTSDILGHDVTIGTHSARLGSLEGRMADAETDISGHTFTLASHTATLASHTGSIAVNAFDISALDGAVGSHDITLTSHGSRLTEVEGDIVAVRSDITEQGRARYADFNVVMLGYGPADEIRMTVGANVPAGAFSVAANAEIHFPMNGAYMLHFDMSFTTAATTNPYEAIIGVYLGTTLRKYLRGTRNSAEANDIVRVSGTHMVNISNWASQYVKFVNISGSILDASGSSFDANISVFRIGDL